MDLISVFNASNQQLIPLIQLNMILNPQLAASQNLTPDRLNDISYPKYVTDKEDGIRCLLGILPGEGLVPISRSLKMLPNIHLYQWAQDHGIAGLDGEIILTGESFHDIQSWVMTQYPMPRSNFEYLVFDHMPDVKDKGYLQRVQKAKNRVDMYVIPNTRVLMPVKVHSPSELLFCFHDAIERGKEGLIVRDPNGKYKSHSRCTFLEENALKMKLYEDKEGTVVGFLELQANNNPVEVSRLGYTKRSSHKGNKKGMQTLGALIIREDDTGIIFNLGSGYTERLRQDIWDDQSGWMNARIIYKEQIHGKKEKPRTPIFKARKKD